MKVILRQDVAKIGKRSQIVSVPDGYALNKLIPQGMAELATAANEKRISRQQAVVEASKDAEQTVFTEAVTALTAKTLQIPVEPNEQGHTFKAVSKEDITAAAKADGIVLPEKMIEMETPIKSVGEHVIRVVSGSDTADVTIAVVKK